MDIAINCRFLTQEITGTQRFAEELVEEYLHLGYRSRLLAPRSDLRKNEICGVPVEQFGTHEGIAWEQIDLARKVNKEKLFLVNLVNSGPLLVGRELVVVHDISWKRIAESYTRIARIYYNLMTRALVCKRTRIATVSQFSRGEISRFLRVPEKSVTIIPNAVPRMIDEIVEKEPSSAPLGRYFLAVGTAARHKNFSTLMRGYWEYATRSSNPAKLVIVGGESKVLAGGSPTAGELDDHVVSLGRVPDDELKWLYTHARSFVFPSLYEGFGIPPLEAQSCGCPVLASSAASLPEVLGDSAIYFDPRDPTDLAGKLSRVDADGDIRSQLVIRGRENIRRWSWKTSAKILADVLKDIR